MDEIIDRYDDREYTDAKTQCDLCAFTPVPVERAEDYLNDENHICTFFDDDECQATFVYGYNNVTGTLEVIIYCCISNFRSRNKVNVKSQ